jgi:hypothetical protein
MTTDPRHADEFELPTHTVLGPDPEPLGERFEVLMSADACPLSEALGATAQCSGRSCVYFGMPGVPMDCAIRQWAPDIVDDPDLASWYRDRAAAEKVLAAAGH